MSGNSVTFQSLEESPRGNSATACYSVHRYDSINEVPANCNALFDKTARSFFLTRTWYEILEKTTRPEQDRFFYLTLEDDTQVLAFMALRAPAGQLGSSLQGQNTGAGSIASLTNWYSCLYDVLLSPDLGDPESAIRNVVKSVREELGTSAVIELNYLDQRSTTPEMLYKALKSTGLVTLRYHHAINRYEDLRDSDFNQYMKSRSPNIRKGQARRRRRLAEKFQLEQVIYSDDSQLDKVLADYLQVYTASWKDPERYAGFIPELFRRGLAEDRLRVGILYLDGKPVATEVYILFNNQATAYKGAYDPAYQKYAPSSVLQVYAVKHLMEIDRVCEIDFGYGDEPYKKSWLSQRRDLTGILAFNPRSVRGLGLLLRYTGKRVIRKLAHVKNNCCRSS